jgi:two-component system phosphate regulon sensor histidine kinase PhoR
MAAHDIRAPLTVIRGYAEILSTMAETDLTEINFADFNEFLNTIRVQTDWLDTIINNILGLDQIENDQLILHIVPCDLKNVLVDTCDMMQATARLNQRTLTYSMADGEAIVAGDQQRLQQILQNLIGNGIKYNRSGGTVHIDLSTTENMAVVTVADSGFGIAPDQLPFIFELYYRTESAQQSQVRGTGLGLFIVKTLVEAHHGSIDVVSRTDVGTTFTVSLPLLVKNVHAAA